METPELQIATEAKPDGYVFGRPTKYDAPTHCRIVLEQGEIGATVSQTIIALGIHTSTYYDWKDNPEKYPYFSEACAHARVLAQAFWEQEARECALYRGEVPLYRNKSVEFILSRMFRNDWGDKQEVLHSGSVEGLTIEFVNARHIAAEDEG